MRTIGEPSGERLRHSDGRATVETVVIGTAVLLMLLIVGSSFWLLNQAEGPVCTTTTAVDGGVSRACVDVGWGTRKDIVAEIRQYATLLIAGLGAVYAFHAFRTDRRTAINDEQTYRQAQEDRADKLGQERAAGANLTTTVNWVDKEAGLARVDFTLKPTDRRIAIIKGRAAPTRLLVVAQLLRNGTLEGELAADRELRLPKRVNKGEERRGLVTLILPRMVRGVAVTGYVIISRVEGWDHVRMVDLGYLTPQGEPTEKAKDLAPIPFS